MMIKDPKLFQDQTIIIQMISTGAPVKKVLSYIVSSIEKHCSIHAHGMIMLYNRKKNVLEQSVGSSIVQIYSGMIEPLQIGPYEGANGTAAFRKESIIIPDIESDILFNKYRDHAAQVGFRSCYSSPILSSRKELLGTFTLYFQEIYQPSSELMEMVEFFKQLATIAIEFSLSQKKEIPLQDYSHDDQDGKQLQGSAVHPLLSELKKALERSEFELYYQPYYGLRKEMIGLEALIRWNHPTDGVLSPASFLSIAEETGFILEMENWVLAQSIKQIKELHNSGMENLRLSVNISAQQLAKEDFPDRIEKLLQELSFSPDKLTLEITERFLIKKYTIGVLHRLKNLGIRISIDDFGVSYSSLQYIRDLSVDELKIDRSFISSIEKDVNSQKIVEMLIMLGHQLNLNIVAEGVEKETQLDLLRRMNCHSVQGFLFSKPLPIENFMGQKCRQQII